jgi:hypothetical protein
MAQGGALNITLRHFKNPAVDDWPMWRAKFQSLVHVRGMDDLQARYTLHQFIDDVAGLATADIHPDPQPVPVGGFTIGDMLNRYQERLMPASASELARTELDVAIQHSSENPLQFHGRVRALYRRAFPLDPDNEAHMIPIFRKGLAFIQVREAVQRGNPQTYQQALNLANAETSILTVRMAPQNQMQQQMTASDMGFGTPQPLGFGAPQQQQQAVPMDCSAIQRMKHPMLNTVKPGTDKTCYFCDSPNHLRPQCTLWVKAKEMGATSGGSGSNRGGKGQNQGQRQGQNQQGQNQRGNRGRGGQRQQGGRQQFNRNNNTVNNGWSPRVSSVIAELAEVIKQEAPLPSAPQLEAPEMVDENQQDF